MDANRNLYNKYRPTCLSEVYGQEVVKKLLKNILNRERLLQSFLFYGSQGTGKTSVARIFAKIWNCERFEELGDVCNQCRNCSLINESKTMDICEMDSASHSGVDNVREIIQNSHYMPLDLNKKVYLIDECHNLSNSAWNALLKTIEEPSSDRVIFIFLTTRIDKIPMTIVSRCQKYNFSLLGEEELSQVMERVSRGEGRGLDGGAKRLLVDLSQGSARECVSLMEQIFLASDEPTISARTVESVCALSNKEEHMDFLNLLFRANHPENREKLLAMVEQLIERSAHILNYFKSLLDIVMDLHIFGLTSNSYLLRRVNEFEVQQLTVPSVSYLRIGDLLFAAICAFDDAYSPGDWARMVLFRLISSVMEDLRETPRIERPVTPVVATAAPAPIEENLSFPKAIEMKALYNTVVSNRNLQVSKRNYEIYRELKNKQGLNENLRKVLFQPSIVFGDEQLITTDKTALLIFKDRREADLFNATVKEGSDEEYELNLLFCGNYFWWAATPNQMKFYKTTPKFTDLEINKAFGDSEKFLDFDQMLEILDVKK